MAGIRRFIRVVLAFVSAAILVPVIGEFFIDLITCLADDDEWTSIAMNFGARQSIFPICSQRHPLSGKIFERCLIRGPVFVKLQGHNTLAFCSSANPTQTILTLQEGSPIIGACIADHTTFRQCFFDTVTLVGTPEDTRNYRRGVDPLSLEQWKKRVRFPLITDEPDR